MFNAQWALALKIQFIIAVVAVVVSVLFFKIRFRTALFSVLLVNAIPVATPLGFKTPLFVHDFFIPIFVLLCLLHFDQLRGKMFWLCFLAVFCFPLAGTLLGARFNIAVSNAWITYLFRRFAYFLFFGLAVCGVFKKINVGEFLETAVLVWTLIAVVGMAQYMGIINVDFMQETVLGESLKIGESSSAQRGFMGLNRGAVGVWGACFSTYCISVLLLEPKMRPGQFWLFCISAVVSYGVIAFSGSRTGVVSCLGGIGFMFLRLPSLYGHVKYRRLVLLAIIVLVGLGYLLAPGAETVKDRLDITEAVSGSSLASRLGTQMKTMRYILTDIRGFVMGIGGGSVSEFRVRIAELSHTHSEYIQVLWESGVIGLALYLFLIFSIFKSLCVSYRLTGSRDVIGIASQNMLMSGVIGGLAVGHLMFTSNRLASFSMLMFCVYGLIIYRANVFTQEFSLQELEPTEL